MQYSIRHTPRTPRTQAALTIAVAAASVLLLLVFSARAAAEGLDPVAATSSASVQATLPPTPEAVTSEPVEAAEPEPVSEAASVAAESASSATPSAASQATPTHPSTAHLPSTTDHPAPDVRAVSNVAKNVAAVPSTDQALEQLAQAAPRVPTKATAAIVDSARSTVEAVGQVVPVDDVHTLPHHPLQMASGAVQMARGALLSGVRALAVPGGLEGLRSSSGGPLEVGADTFSPPARTPAIPTTATTGLRRPELTASLDNSPIRHLLDFAGVEPLPPGVPGVSISSSPSRDGLDQADLGDVFTAPVDERFADDFTPLDGNAPQPAPGSSQDGAAGAGGTSFIPIAALLALLALAAPAIRRRFGEGPDLWPQTPFVCALERPG
jgi:hypothetical protein